METLSTLKCPDLTFRISGQNTVLRHDIGIKAAQGSDRLSAAMPSLAVVSFLLNLHYTVFSSIKPWLEDGHTKIVEAQLSRKSNGTTRKSESTRFASIRIASTMIQTDRNDSEAPGMKSNPKPAKYGFYSPFHGELSRKETF